MLKKRIRRVGGDCFAPTRVDLPQFHAAEDDHGDAQDSQQQREYQHGVVRCNLRVAECGELLGEDGPEASQAGGHHKDCRGECEPCRAQAEGQPD